MKLWRPVDQIQITLLLVAMRAAGISRLGMTSKKRRMNYPKKSVKSCQQRKLPPPPPKNHLISGAATRGA